MRRMAMLVFLLYLMILLTACNAQSGTALALRSAAPVDPEAYGAVPGFFRHVNGVRVQNDFGGDIVVVEHELPQATQEVTLDYTAYSTGPDSVRASADARRAVNVTMSYETDGWVVVLARTTQQAQQPGQGVRLHIRVPRSANLDLRTSAGRITVSGEVNKVYANATGRIEVHGALGEMALETTGGGIVADGGYDHHIETRLQNGDITIFSVGASVTAAITETGGIEFVGTLRGKDNSFVTATGPITVALPEDVPYSFYVYAPSGQLATDFRLDKGGNPAQGPRPVCGQIDNGQTYDYHARYLEDIYGHLYVAFANAGTYLSGTLSTDSYYFYTDRTDIAVYTRFPQAIHIYPAAARNPAGQLQGVPDCDRLPPEPEVRFTVSTKSGFVFIHHILMNRQYAADP